MTFFLAYKDYSCDMFEDDIIKIRNKYIFGKDGLWYTSKFFYDVVVFLPIGLLGHIREGKTQFLKILWLIKCVRM